MSEEELHRPSDQTNFKVEVNKQVPVHENTLFPPMDECNDFFIAHISVQ